MNNSDKPVAAGEAFVTGLQTEPLPFICNCYDKAPTIPTYRAPGSHLHDCPLFTGEVQVVERVVHRVITSQGEREEAAKLCELEAECDVRGTIEACERRAHLLRLAASALRRPEVTELPVDCPPDVAMAILHANVSHDANYPIDGIKRSQRIWSGVRAALSAALGRK